MKCYHPLHFDSCLTSCLHGGGLVINGNFNDGDFVNPHFLSLHRIHKVLTACSKILLTNLVYPLSAGLLTGVQWLLTSNLQSYTSAVTAQKLTISSQ